MLNPLAGNRNIEIVENVTVESGVLDLNLYGSYLEIEGYASVKGLNTFSEEKIRKTLLLIPKVDIEKYRETNEETSMLSDEEIINLKTIKVALENIKYSELESNETVMLREDMDPLSGFKGMIDLSTIIGGKPLPAGDYDIYIKLEQFADDEDNIKYEKNIPISNVKEHMRSKLLTSKIEYFTARKVLKYNIVITFNHHTKTLRLKNTLLQSYNPKEMPSNVEGKESRFFSAFKRKLFKMMYVLFSVLPINKNKITFASDSRSELNGNLYFVYEELFKRKMDLNIKFIFNERINNKKSIIDLVKTSFHFATSKIILLDDFYPLIYPLRIRRNADLIQVWHAAGAFKTFGYSRLGRPGGPSPYSKNHKNYTKVVVSSEGVRENYAEGFGVTVDKVYATGVPRSDIFFDEEYKAHVTNTLQDKYPFLKDKKVILFAPTFRGNGQASAHYPFEILNFKKLYEELHEEYVFLLKIHPFVKNKLTIPYEYADFFYDLSDYREINDLLLVTDILITDYSSVCFEFALLNKPMLFFAFDVEKYIEERDFYYDYFDFIPGRLVKTTNEIIRSIKEEQFESEKIKSFVNYFFDDTLGKASKNVVDELIIPSLNKEYVKEEKKHSILPPPSSRIELFERSLKADVEDEDRL